MEDDTIVKSFVNNAKQHVTKCWTTGKSKNLVENVTKLFDPVKSTITSLSRSQHFRRRRLVHAVLIINQFLTITAIRSPPVCSRTAALTLTLPAHWIDVLITHAEKCHLRITQIVVCSRETHTIPHVVCLLNRFSRMISHRNTCKPRSSRSIPELLTSSTPSPFYLSTLFNDTMTMSQRALQKPPSSCKCRWATIHMIQPSGSCLKSPRNVQNYMPQGWSVGRNWHVSILLLYSQLRRSSMLVCSSETRQKTLKSTFCSNLDVLSYSLATYATKDAITEAVSNITICL